MDMLSGEENHVHASRDVQNINAVHFAGFVGFVKQESKITCMGERRIITRDIDRELHPWRSLVMSQMSQSLTGKMLRCTYTEKVMYWLMLRQGDRLQADVGNMG